jgi:excisionase family DNA binding protein
MAQATAAPRRGADEDALTIAEIVVLLKISRSTFYMWKATGKAPRCYKLPNGQIRIRRADYDEWFASLAEAA